MRVALTGTPGTGKTTTAAHVDVDLEVIHLNDLIREEGLAEGEDPQRGSLVADLDAVRARLEGRDDLLVESHLSHHLDVDRVIVLRCHPRQLRERLLDRGADGDATDAEADGDAVARKARENAEAEALDVVLSEAVEAHGLECVYEIDTTDRDPEAVAADVEAAVGGDRDPSAGEVDFLEYL